MQNAINIYLTTRSDLTYSSSDYEDAYCHADRSKILSGIASKSYSSALTPNPSSLGSSAGHHILGE